MNNSTKVSEAQMRVMEKIWAYGKEITVLELLTMLNNDGESWAYQTVATFLTRLETKKKLINHVKKGKTLYYYPVMSKEEYNRREVKNFLNANFSGSLKKLLSAFSKGDGLSKEDIEELREWFDEFDTK